MRARHALSSHASLAARMCVLFVLERSDVEPTLSVLTCGGALVAEYGRAHTSCLGFAAPRVQATNTLASRSLLLTLKSRSVGACRKLIDEHFELPATAYGTDGKAVVFKNWKIKA